jgi:predicted outer membrane repeat protein
MKFNGFSDILLGILSIPLFGLAVQVNSHNHWNNQPNQETLKTITASITAPMITFDDPQRIPLSGDLNGILEPDSYLVVGDITVQAGESLTIEPGTVISFLSNYNFDIYGLLSAVGTDSDSIYFESANSPNNWGSINFYIGSSDESILSYCRISGASGTAFNIYNVDITIENCTITNNSGIWGGGIYCSYCRPTIIGCTISENIAAEAGGGIYCTIASPSILNCNIHHNSSNWLGGGICCNNSSYSTIEGCIIYDNQSDQCGAGVGSAGNSHPQLTRCLIYQNSTNGNGGAIGCMSGSNTFITNCTITANYAGNYGGAVYSGYTSSIFLNTILWGDSATNQNNELFGYNAATYCDVEDGYSGEGNLNTDPLFVDPSNADFHLQAESPCIDAGDPNSPHDPDSTIADIGAFYFHHFGVTNQQMENFPLAFQLYQNYPNPFNAMTTISFSIPFNTPINLSVFDLTGRQVTTLLSGLCQAGRYRATFDGSNLASGVYFYRLQTEQFHRVGKMILLK